MARRERVTKRPRGRPCNDRRAYAARVSLAARRAIQKTMSEQKDPNEAAAEQYAAEHGGAFVRWLQDNTVECCCEEPYTCDADHRTGGTINADTELLCRRCFVPVGLQDVSLLRPSPALHPRAAVRRRRRPTRRAAMTSSRRLLSAAAAQN